ncbi:hypothetical protein OROGR_019591 [Orobanche gracilis]
MALSLPIDDVSAISKEKNEFKIIVEVVQRWLTQSYDHTKRHNTLELVLMDAKGDKIHATVRRTHVYKFSPLLVEDRVYMLSYFIVDDCARDFRTTTHGYKIIFDFNSVVQTLTDVLITKSPNSFVSVSDIMFNDPDQTLLVVRIECAFFGSYVQEVLSSLSARDLTSAVVLIQYAKIKPFRGKQSLQNAYGATQIIFNPEIPEANAVREKFFEMNEPGSHVLSQLSDSSKLSLDEEFLKISDMRTLKDIKAMDEGPLFRLQARVMEGNHIVTLVIFDKETSTLLQTTCADLLNPQQRYNLAGSTTPIELLNLVKKTFLFRIEVNNTSNSKFEPSYRVKKICADRDLIYQFKEAVLSPNRCYV